MEELKTDFLVVKWMLGAILVGVIYLVLEAFFL